MLRDKALIPLSRQHQHSLALCVRLTRALEEEAGAIDPDTWQAEIAEHFEQETAGHFAAEEGNVFPLAAEVPELQPLVQDLLAEHVLLRALVKRAAERNLDALGLAEFAEKLSSHIRKEERQLFEGMQSHLTAGQLAAMGRELEKDLPAEVCRLQKS
jgi:hemerythrin-like domain-containing protein